MFDRMKMRYQAAKAVALEKTDVVTIIVANDKLIQYLAGSLKYMQDLGITDYEIKVDNKKTKINIVEELKSLEDLKKELLKFK